MKGIGAVHAKWSPVATAGYRMMPEIRFKHPKGVRGELARDLVRLHGDIFDLEEATSGGRRRGRGSDRQRGKAVDDDSDDGDISVEDDGSTCEEAICCISLAAAMRAGERACM